MQWWERVEGRVVGGRQQERWGEQAMLLYMIAVAVV